MEQEALFAGIRAEPDDDVVRLAYADWLEEHDRPDEAELIRVQLRLAAVGDHERRVARWLESDPGLRKLEERDAALTRKMAELAAPALAELGCRQPSFRRGILEEVSMPASVFVANGAELVRRFPVVAVRLTHVGTRLRAVLQTAALAVIRDLGIEDGPVAADDQFAAFAEADHFATNLRTLRVADFRLTTLAAQMLATAPALAGLRKLALYACNLDFRQITALAGPSTFAGLEELRMEHEKVEAASRPHEWPAHLPRLRRLTLRRVGANVVAAFLGAASWPGGLSALDLSRNPIGAEGLATLTRHDLSGLRELDLAQCSVGDRGVRILAESATLTGLERLDLSSHFGQNRITDEAAEVLASSPHFNRLRELNLLHNHVGAAGVRALAASTTLPREVVLHLSHAGTILGREALRRRFRAVNFV